jgi:hypothetical protein
VRARNIKPGFFRNDELAACTIAARLLFVGMWTLADREGRLEDRPGKIKFQLLPTDQFDAEEAVAELAAHGFLSRYEANGHRYIQVVNWDKHQNPHIKEAASTIPAPDMHDASTVQASDEPCLIPRSLDSLIPRSLDSLIPKDNTAAREGDVDDMTELERGLVAEIKLVRGMDFYDDAVIVAEIREANESRGSPVSDQSLMLDAKRFRKHYTAERMNQPIDRKWRGGTRAVFNWFTRTRDMPTQNGKPATTQIGRDAVDMVGEMVRSHTG